MTLQHSQKVQCKFVTVVFSRGYVYYLIGSPEKNVATKKTRGRTVTRKRAGQNVRESGECVCPMSHAISDIRT